MGRNCQRRHVMQVPPRWSRLLQEMLARSKIANYKACLSIEHLRREPSHNFAAGDMEAIPLPLVWPPMYLRPSTTESIAAFCMAAAKQLSGAYHRLPDLVAKVNFTMPLQPVYTCLFRRSFLKLSAKASHKAVKSTCVGSAR